MVTKAQKEATQRYQQKAYDRFGVRFPKGYVEEVINPAAERAGESVNAYIQKAIADRIARESAQDAAILGQVITALAEAQNKPYMVTFRTSEVAPPNTVRSSGRNAQKVVKASSEAEAKVVFFGWLKEQMQSEVAFEDATRIGMKRDDGVIEICEIVSVE